MNHVQDPIREPSDQVEAFILAGERGELTDEQVRDFERLLCDDPQSRRAYAQYILETTILRDWAARATKDVNASPSTEPAGNVPGTENISQIPTPSPYLGFLGSAYNGVTGYFSTHDVARALLIVTLIFAPIVGFAVYALLQPDQQVAKAPKPEPLGPALFPHEGARAGAITGTLDCVWKDSQLRFPETDVCVGDVFRIDAGLMEITYDTGAKVILQAPTNYTVTSKTGGYLDIGRLTAKMGVKPKAWQKSRFGVPEAGNEELGANNEERKTSKEELPTPTSSLLLPTSSFVVNTPTAVVTDLGTEFGVHVDNRGATESLVFVGTVTVHTPAAEGEKPAEEFTLYASDSARVEQKGQGDKATYTVQRNIVKPASFVRVLRRALPPEPVLKQSFVDGLDVIALFRLGEDDPGAEAGKPANEETIGQTDLSVNTLERHGSPTYTADTAAPGSKLAMSFSGSDSEFFSSGKLFASVTDYFIYEAWVRPRKVGIQDCVVMYNGHTAYNGYGLMVRNDNWSMYFGSFRGWDSAVKCEPGQWTHVAIVCERGKARLWVNGQPTAVACEIDPRPGRRV